MNLVNKKLELSLVGVGFNFQQLKRAAVPGNSRIFRMSFLFPTKRTPSKQPPTKPGNFWKTRAFTPLKNGGNLF